MEEMRHCQLTMKTRFSIEKKIISHNQLYRRMTYLTLDNQLQKWFHLLWERKRGRKDHLLFYKPETREHARLQVLLMMLRRNLGFCISI